MTLAMGRPGDGKGLWVANTMLEHRIMKEERDGTDVKWYPSKEYHGYPNELRIGEWGWQRDGSRHQTFTNFWSTLSDNWLYGPDPDLISNMLEQPDAIKDADIGLHELQMTSPRRRAMNRVNVDLGMMLTQRRKRGLDMWADTQFPQVMDTWILLQIDLFMRCATYDGGHSLYVRAYDYWGLWTRDDRRKPWPIPAEMFDWHYWIHNPSRIFGHYNTKEEANPIWLTNRAELLEREYGSMGSDLTHDDPKGPNRASDLERPPETMGLPPAELVQRQMIMLESQFDIEAVNGVCEVGRLVNAAFKLGIISRKGEQGKNELREYMEHSGYVTYREGRFSLVKKRTSL